MKIIKILSLVTLFASCDTPLFTPEEDFITPFELTDGGGGTSYEETIDFYKKLATNYSSVSLKTMSTTDSGLPLYLVIFNSDGIFDFNRIRKNKMILFITNGMNEKAREGVDATMQLMRNLAQKQIEIPAHTVVVTIPIMNYLGQMEQEALFKGQINTFLERNLNEDFIENKSLNTRSFVEIFHQVNPHFLVDTYSLAGDVPSQSLFYQTIIPEKLGKVKYYLEENFIPQLSDSLAKRPVEDSLGRASRKLLAYPSAQSFASTASIVGYASLWNTIGIQVASRMKNPYKNRVEDMYNALKNILLLVDSHKELIENLQDLEGKEMLKQQKYILSHRLVSAKDSLPIEKTLYEPKDTIAIAKSYVIPQLLTKVIDNLKRNHIELHRFEKDSLLSVYAYTLKAPKDSLSVLTKEAMEKKMTLKKQKIAIRKGDIWVLTGQKGRKYLLETLEPYSENGFMKTNMLPLLPTPKDSLWIYPIFSIEK